MSLHSLEVHMYIGICVYTYVSRSKGKHVFICVSGTYMYVDACVCMSALVYVDWCVQVHVCL